MNYVSSSHQPQITMKFNTHILILIIVKLIYSRGFPPPHLKRQVLNICCQQQEEANYYFITQLLAGIGFFPHMASAHFSLLCPSAPNTPFGYICFIFSPLCKQLLLSFSPQFTIPFIFFSPTSPEPHPWLSKHLWRQGAGDQEHAHHSVGWQSHPLEATERAFLLFPDSLPFFLDQIMTLL